MKKKVITMLISVSLICLCTSCGTNGADNPDRAISEEVAVESKYSTYAEGDTSFGRIKESRDHRGFGGFSMGSVNTWCTFRYCLDYFRYFMPMSGNYTTDGSFMASLVMSQGYGPEDFFIFSASGTSDFACNAFKAQIMSMGNDGSDVFRFGNSEIEGNLSFRERKGYSHDKIASDIHTMDCVSFGTTNKAVMK